MAPCVLGRPLTALDAHDAIQHYHGQRAQERVEHGTIERADSRSRSRSKASRRSCSPASRSARMAGARQQRQGDVGLQPGTASRRHQRDRMLQRERPRRPPGPLSPGRLYQRCNTAGHQVVAFGLPDCPDQHVVRSVPSVPMTETPSPSAPLDVPSGQVGQPDGAQLFTRRLADGVPVQGHRPGREAVHATSEPVVERIANREAPFRPQAAFPASVSRRGGNPAHRQLCR